MARRKTTIKTIKTAWLVTFSDLVTLMLTFFVLMLSMSSMDTAVIARISAQMRSLSHVNLSGPGKLPERIELVTAMLKDPANILAKRKRLKDLLFPRDILPPDLSYGDLEKNLEILQDPEGVVIVLTEELLFAKNAYNLDARGKKLLDALTPVIHAVNADANISGHSDPGSEDASSLYRLSFLRAATVLEYFLQNKLEADRFSVSGYGADRPMVKGNGNNDRGQNRRVEILLKTTPRTGSYI